MDKIIQLHSLPIFSKDLIFNIQNLQYKNLSSGKGQKTEVGLRPLAWNFIKKETLAQVFSCEFCEISKNTFFTEHLRMTASEKNYFNGTPLWSLNH